jgi:Uma2 family endonuclease
MSLDAVQTKRHATYEDLLEVPDTKVAEIVDGELIVSPRPAAPHAFAATGIAVALGAAFHGTDALAGPGGWWTLPEPELHFAADVLVPDLAAWRCARMPAVPNVAAFTLAPDWLCEIISPSSARHDRIAKMRCYAREGVASVWLVDPLARTLESFRLDGGRWTVVASHAADEVVRVEPFEAVEIRLARWWLASAPVA